jgi:hypothetical protein
MIVELALANHNLPTEWLDQPADLIITAMDVLEEWEREARKRG